jgi:DNA-directed RNA polymerase specialized sigma24 family protein
MTEAKVTSYRVRCVSAPQIDALPPAVAGRLRWDGATGEVVLSGEVGTDELRALRDVHPDDPGWQVTVDRLAALAFVDQRSRLSRFPLTQWGLLLNDLSTDEDAHWRRFMEAYRKPIGTVIAKALAMRGRGNAEPAQDLAEEFFGWFFAKGIHRKLRRTGDDGTVFRFRGYLKRCVITFLRERRGRGREHATDDLEPIAPVVEEELGAEVDRAIAIDAVATEMDVIRRVQRQLWDALVADFQGLTLKDASERLGGSVPTQHRVRKRARAILRSRLLQGRLATGVVTEEDAEIEMRELIPALADALRSYAKRHGS